jgi:two-component system sensor histidine kinase MtrB
VRYAETGDERHRLATDVPAAPLVVAGDAGRLEQILDNLLSNAVKYSPAGREIGVSLPQAVDGIVLTVRDAGIGLTPGAHERIFKLFGRAAMRRSRGCPGWAWAYTSADRSPRHMAGACGRRVMAKARV